MAGDDAFNVNINTPRTITKSELLDNDIDVDLDTLNITAVDDTGTNGTIVLNGDQSITYTPVVDAQDVTDTFTYTLSDGSVSDTATVTISVVQNNKPVGVADDAGDTNEDTDLTIAIADLVSNDTDIDGHTLTISSVSNAVNGSVVIDGTNVVFTPSEDYSGSASFDYVVNDGIDDSDSAVTVSINVVPVNDAPEFADNYDNEVFETQSVNGSVSATDIDNDDASLTYSLDTDGNCGNAVVNSDGSYTYTNTDDTCETDSFTVVANDGTADSTPVTVNITIKDSLVAVDPYIVGAQFCADTNANGTCDEGEPLSTITDEEGKFVFADEIADGTAIIMLNTATGTHIGIPFDGILIGSIDSPVITPMTTMIGNGFTAQQIVDIMADAGVTITTDDLARDPMSLFSGPTVQVGDYPVMHAVIAVNTFLRMTSYGLTPGDALDGNGDLVEPYASALSAAVSLAQTAINSTYIDAGAPPRIVVYIGVAISNYLVDTVASMEQESEGTGQAFLAAYLLAATTDYDNSDFKSHIDMLAAKYTEDNTVFYMLKDVGYGVFAVESQLGQAVEFTEYGYDFDELKFEASNRIDGNDVIHNDGANTVTLIAYKDDLIESTSEIETAESEFDNKKGTIEATLSLDNASSDYQKAAFNGGMHDFETGQAYFFEVNIFNDEITYQVVKDTYNPDGTIASEDVEQASGFINGSGDYVGKDLTINISSDHNGLVTMTVSEGATLVGSETYQLPSTFNPGFTVSSVLVEVDTSADPDLRDETTTVTLKDFNTQDFTTQTIALNDVVLFGDADMSWVDVSQIVDGPILQTMEFELSGADTYEYDEEENSIINITLPSSTSIGIKDDTDTVVETCQLSGSFKINVFDEKTYDDLYRSTNTCTTVVEHTDQSTWSLQYDDYNAFQLDVGNNGFSFYLGYFPTNQFNASDLYAYLNDDGTVLLADRYGNDPVVPRDGYVIGTWGNSGSSIDVDLSDDYNLLKSFTVDGNGMVVESSIYQIGYEEINFVWTGDDAIELFIDTTGWNLWASVSNKIIHGTAGNEESYMVFNNDGRYSERYYENGALIEVCFGKWKQFDTDTFAYTCDNNDNEPTNEDSEIAADNEMRMVVNSTAQTSAGLYPTNVTFTEANDPIDEGTSSFGPLDVDSNAVSDLEAISSPAEVTIGDYTVKAYVTDVVTSTSGTDIIVSFSLNGTNNGFTLDPAYTNTGYVLLKVFDSEGKIVTTTEYKQILTADDTISFGELMPVP